MNSQPIGERLSITSLGVFRCSGVSTTPGATAFTRMPSLAYSIARCWVIVSKPPLAIIGTAAVTPRTGLRARAAVIVITLPPVCCANICLMASRVTYRKPSRFVETNNIKVVGRVVREQLGEENPRVIDQHMGSDLNRDGAVSTIATAVAQLPDVAVDKSDSLRSRDLRGFADLSRIGDHVKGPFDERMHDARTDSWHALARSRS